MVRKVKLDLLEIEPDILETAQIATGHEEAPVDTGSETGGKSGWRFNKIFLIGSVLLLILSVGVTLWYQLVWKPEPEPERPRTTESASRPASAGSLEHFRNFAVDFRDAQGQYKVLLCDVAVELTPGGKLTLETAEIRKVIYRTLHAKSIQDLTVARGKKAIKKDLEAELNQATGTKSIKQVFFTRFTLM